MYKIILSKNADKSLENIFKGDKNSAKHITLFLKELENTQNPIALQNVKKLQNYTKRLSLENRKL